MKGTAQVNLAVLDDAGKTERFSTSFHSVSCSIYNKKYNKLRYKAMYKFRAFKVHMKLQYW